MKFEPFGGLSNLHTRRLSSAVIPNCMMHRRILQLISIAGDFGCVSLKSVGGSIPMYSAKARTMTLSCFDCVIPLDRIYSVDLFTGNHPLARTRSYRSSMVFKSKCLSSRRNSFAQQFILSNPSP